MIWRPDVLADEEEIEMKRQEGLQPKTEKAGVRVQRQAESKEGHEIADRNGGWRAARSREVVEVVISD